MSAAPSVAPSTEQIQTWIGELDSDIFDQRKTATEKLVETGSTAIDPLVAAVPEGSLELTTRVVYIFRELALSEDLATEVKARLALELIASQSGGPAARQATDALAMLDEIRRGRAASDLQQLGAKIGFAESRVSLQVEAGVRTIEIGEQFRGQPNDLRRLRWLTKVQQIVLTGPQITDATMRHLSEMQSLMYIVVKRAKITDVGISHLRGLDKLRQISVLYSPIGDASVEHLKVQKNTILIKLYGTKISRQGADRLQLALVTTKIDFREGAFLGVGCLPHVLGCQVAIVHPDSSAARAGLQAMDIIVRYNDKKVADFEGLTALIGGNIAGDTVELSIIRGEQALKKKVKLGEWE